MERNEKLNKKKDSLKADNAELKSGKMLSLKSDQLRQILQEKRERDAVEFGVQTDDLLWQEFLSEQKQERGTFNQSTPHNATITNDQMTGGVASARSGTNQNAASNPAMLGGGLVPSQNHNSRVLEQLSEYMSGDVSMQRPAAEMERIQMLVEKANSYEIQQ